MLRAIGAVRCVREAGDPRAATDRRVRSSMRGASDETSPDRAADRAVSQYFVLTPVSTKRHKEAHAARRSAS